MYWVNKLIERCRKKTEVNNPPRDWKGYYFICGDDDEISVGIEDNRRNVNKLNDFYLTTELKPLFEIRKFSHARIILKSTSLEVAKNRRDYGYRRKLTSDTKFSKKKKEMENKTTTTATTTTKS